MTGRSASDIRLLGGDDTLDGRHKFIHSSQKKQYINVRSSNINQREESGGSTSGKLSALIARLFNEAVQEMNDTARTSQSCEAVMS